MVSRIQQKRGVGPLAGAKLSGVVMNSKNLRRVRPLLEENQDAEFMYLRENEIKQFAPAAPLEKLRVLDLSMNQIGPKVSFTPNLFPRLHHLYLSVNKIESLEGFSGLIGLETLCISDNAISSFQGLSNLPNLRVLSLNFNAITSFDQYPSLPNLHTLNLVGNPVCEKSSYRNMAIAINNSTLVSIDGKPVKDEERAAVEHYKGKVVYCIRSGHVIENEGNMEADADTYMLHNQRSHVTNDNGIVRLNYIRTAPEGGQPLMEGNPIKLAISMQDVRPAQEVEGNLFNSPHVFPAVFTIKGDASEALLVGSMNNWSDPIELSRVEKEDGEEGGAATFTTTLYLPIGEYEYRFLLDGEERLDDSGSHSCSQGSCNKREIKDVDTELGEQTTIFHIRWMRQTANGSFELIEREHGITYVPTKADIGCCIRSEVLAYINGQFSFLFFDITAPVAPAPPRCTRLEIKGQPQENQVLMVEADYFGGEEGSSSLTWSRVTLHGQEIPIPLQNPFNGFKVTKECIGCVIKATFTPVRNDWVPGESKSAVTETITEGNPECESIKIIGNLIEDSLLEVEVVYAGGTEGQSTYQWLRKGPSNQYIAIEGQTGTTYRTTFEDVGKSLAVEYTPINDVGKEGEACRCVLDNLIAPAVPEIRNISIYGELKENEVLVLQYEYIGGMAGSHIIHWYRRHPGAKKPTRIGTGNSSTLTLSQRDIGSYIEVTMTPVRSDNARGATVLAKTSSVVLPGEPCVKYINIVGRAVVGNSVEVEVDYAGGEQGASFVLWEVEDPLTGEVKQVSGGQFNNKYEIARQDVGKNLRVTYVPYRIDGRKGEPKSHQVYIK